MNISEIQDKLENFASERDWGSFILQKIYQWLSVLRLQNWLRFFSG